MWYVIKHFWKKMSISEIVLMSLIHGWLQVTLAHVCALISEINCNHIHLWDHTVDGVSRCRQLERVPRILSCTIAERHFRCRDQRGFFQLLLLQNVWYSNHKHVWLDFDPCLLPTNSFQQWGWREVMLEGSSAQSMPGERAGAGARV